MSTKRMEERSPEDVIKFIISAAAGYNGYKSFKKVFGQNRVKTLYLFGYGRKKGVISRLIRLITDSGTALAVGCSTAAMTYILLYILKGGYEQFPKTWNECVDLEEAKKKAQNEEEKNEETDPRKVYEFIKRDGGDI